MITVRKAREDDAARIVDIAAASISPEWTPSFVNEGAGRGDTQMFVALEGGAKPDIVGFAVFRQVGGDGELLQIAVAAGHRRRGIGSALMDAVLEYASEKALASVFLEVRSGNSAAIGLYKKHGFRHMRIRKNYYNDPAEDAIVMVRA